MRSRVSGPGTKPAPSRTTSVTAAPTGSRSSSMCTPASREPGAHVELQQVGVHPFSSGAVSTWISVGLGRRGHPQQPGGRAERARLHQGEDDDQHEDGVEQPVRARACRPTAGSWPARSAPRRAARPRTGTPAPPADPVAGRRGRAPAGPAPRVTTDSGRASSTRAQPDDQRRHQRAGQPAGRDQQAEQHEQADLGDPGQAVGEAEDGPPVRQPGVAEHHPGDVDGEEAGGVGDGAGRVREDGEPDRGERVEPGRRQRGAAQRPAARPRPPPARSPRPRPARSRRAAARTTTGARPPAVALTAGRPAAPPGRR